MSEDGEPDSKRPRNGDTVEDLRAQMLAMQQQLESQKAQIKALEATKKPQAAPATPTGGRRKSIGSPNNSAEPSRVLHCRDLPPDATEAEAAAGAAYGSFPRRASSSLGSAEQS